MAYLLFFLISIFLFIGFLVMTRVETVRGKRYFAPVRANLDARARRIEEEVSENDLPLLLRTTVQKSAARLAHDAAHAILQLVRFIERMLTHTVRTLRSHHLLNAAPSPKSDAPSSDFVATMKDFKEELRNGRATEE